MRFVLLHGFTGAPSSLTDLVGGAETFAPFLPGHGSAPRLCPTGSFDDAVDDLADRIPWAAPCTLVGYSMGARVGLRLLARHPRRFARAVLVGAHPGLDDEVARAERRRWEAGLAETLTTQGIARFVDDWEALPVLCPVRSVPAERLARRRAIRLGHTARGLAHALAVLGLGTMPGTTSALARIEVPVTLVVGADDDKFRALGRQMAARLPSAELVEVPRCGHDVALEAPEALTDILGGRT